ncbi:MAG: LysR family transcriptional regulator [Burkholderiales bacterium]|nr:LysR family transcriptional regulator [Burkholderiales bacterium]
MVSNSETIILADLRVFLEVAKLLSITRAGDALGVPKSAVSKTLTRLEGQLGVRLLERSSRRVALTPAGRLLTVKAESLLTEAEFLTKSLREERNEPRGTVRMTAPPELGTLFIERVVPLILREYPELRIAMKLAYDFDDLQEPAIDIALRVGQVHDERLVGSAIGEFSRILVASPAYLKTNPLRRPADLADHHCLVFSGNENTAEWEFVRGGVIEKVRVAGNLAVRSFTAQLHAARAGLGVVRGPMFVASEWIKRGELVRALPGWQAMPVTVFAVHRFGHERIARVAAVLKAAKAARWLASD